MFAKKSLKKIFAALALTAAFGFAAQPADAQAPVVGSRLVEQAGKDTAIVYFTKHIDAAHLIKLYNLVNQDITGKVAIKVHTDEKNGSNILPRDLVRELQAAIPNSNLVETNTAYKGDRYTTEDHRETLKVNGWTFCPVDIMDADGDVNLPVKGGFHLKEVAMGGHLVNYDSMLVLTHFKGHASGGFGGSMKNIAIGNASGQMGKKQVHGVPLNEQIPGNPKRAKKDKFMELMADSAKATIDHFGSKITFINVMRRMSVDCDCAGTRAAEPTIPDVGILASKDLLAIDQACCDIVFEMDEKENKDLIARIISRHGLRQLSAMSEKKMGKPKYVLISVDED